MTRMRHRLLDRQLRRAYGVDAPVPPELEGLLALVDQAYHAADDERQLKERALEVTSEEVVDRNSKLRALVDSAPFLMGVAEIRDGDVVLVSGNSAAAEAFGLAPGRAAAMRDASVEPSVRATWIDRCIEASQSSVPVRFEYETGSRAHSATVCAVRSWRGGVAVCYIVEDVTERRRLLEQMAQRDRLASIGTLAAGVAHEVNSPVGYLLTNLVVAMDDLTEIARHAPPQVARALERPLEALRDARAGADRVRAIVKDLRTFARTDAGPVTSVDLSAVLAFAQRVAGVDIRRRARLVADIQPTPPVLGDETRLGQVFLNLLLNAVAAIPEGAPRDHTVTITCGVAADGRVQVEITDTGHGVPQAILPRIFDPFFTSRAREGGTGLGLSISSAIVRALGGEIIVASTQPGGGTTFRVTLVPAVREGPSECATTSVPRNDARSSVLIVDDDPQVGRVLSRILSGEHKVTLAGSGMEGLARLRAEGAGYDVVFCDLRMPEVDGRAVYEDACRERPDLAERFVFITADPTDPSLDALRASGPVRVLAMPFDAAALRQLVRDRLRAS